MDSRDLDTLEKCRAAILRRVRRRYWSISEADAEDVWSEAIVRACRYQVKITPRNIARIAMCAAVDLIRKQVCRRASRERVAARMASKAATTATPDRASELRDTIKSIRKAADELRGRQGIVMRAFLRGFPKTARIAFLRSQVTRIIKSDISAGAVRTLLWRGKRAIAAAVE